VLLISADVIEDILKQKRCGNVSKGVLFLHDSTPAHQALATQKKMAYLGFHYLDHSPCPLDLALSDYHLLPGLKKELKSYHYSSNMEVIAATQT
jgi:hypothetical protein